MRPGRPLPEGAKEDLGVLLKQAKNKSEFQRIQCLWLRASLNLGAAEVAMAIGWKPGSVRQLQARYFKEGAGALKGVGRGGRRKSYLSLEEEERFIGGFRKRATEGGILEVSEIKKSFEEKIGRKVPKSTVYRMLARHGWRKVTPRPRHPKADEVKQDAFKKNSLKSW